MVCILEQGTCLASHPAMPPRQILHWGISGRSAPRLQQPGPTGGECDRVHLARFAPPAAPASISTSHHGGNAAATGEFGKITRPGIPSGRGLRRVLGDLETCAADLLPFSSNSSPEQLVAIAGSKLRSCREAIFSLLRWLDTQQKEVNAPPENPYASKYVLPGSARDAEMHSREADIEKRAAAVDAQGQSCEVTVCRPFDVPHACSNSRQMTTEDKKMCSMCNPRSEELIGKHCAKQRQRQQNVLFLLLGMLATIPAIAIILVFLRKAKGRSRRGLRTGPAYSSEQGGVLPGVMSTIQKSRGLDRMSDVEKDPAASWNGKICSAPSLGISEQDLSSTHEYPTHNQGRPQFPHPPAAIR